MRYFICFILMSLCSSMIQAQSTRDKGLLLKNETLAKEKFIKEGLRIRVETKERKKVTGKFFIINSDTIVLKGIPYNIHQLQKIKRNPILQTILIDGVFFLYGASFVTVGIFVGLLFDVAFAIPIIAVGAGLITVGFLSPNLLRAYHKKKGWQFEIQQKQENLELIPDR